MKKSILLNVILVALFIGGCNQEKDFTIKYNEFTDEQNEVLALTGNRAFKYELNNLPKDNSYDIKIVYEIYKESEKALEKDVITMAYIPTDKKIENRYLFIDIEGNIIRVLSDGIYNYLEIEENLTKLSNCYFNGNRKLNIGDEVYLFHANDNESYVTMSNLGILSKEELDGLIADNKTNVFIKLVCLQTEK